MNSQSVDIGLENMLRHQPKESCIETLDYNHPGEAETH